MKIISLIYVFCVVCFVGACVCEPGEKVDPEEMLPKKKSNVRRRSNWWWRIFCTCGFSFFSDNADIYYISIFIYGLIKCVQHIGACAVVFFFLTFAHLDPDASSWEWCTKPNTIMMIEWPIFVEVDFALHRSTLAVCVSVWKRIESWRNPNFHCSIRTGLQSI